MKLRLKYNNNIHQSVHAAFVRGEKPDIWLKEIDKWNAAPEELDCHLMPGSINSSEVSGLFIVFKKPEFAKQFQLLDIYTCVHDKIFIPANTMLLPQLSKEEIRDIFLYDVHVFHPVIGLVGFESKDKIDLAELLCFREEQLTDWGFAHPGIQPKPAFKQITVIPPEPEELINSIKNEIGQKALTDIPGEGAGDNVFDKITDFFKLIFLGSILGLMKLFNKVLPEGNKIKKDASGKKGLFQKLEEWISINLEELQRKRDDEIKRLLDLLDENTNEGLQYAIPLNSPYLNRGKQTSSSTLTRRPLQFNLGKLGGGTATEFWDIGNRYDELRT